MQNDATAINNQSQNPPTVTKARQKSLNQSIITASQNVIQYTTLATLFLFPLFFLTITPNFFETNKWLLVSIATAINLLAWAVMSLSAKRLSFSLTPLTLPLVAVGVASLVSAYIASPNFTESMAGRGSLVPLFVLFTLIAINSIERRQFITQSVYALGISALILSILSIFQALGVGLSTILNTLLNTNIPQGSFLTPAGSALSYLTFSLPVLLLTLMYAFINKDKLEKAILFVISAVIVSGVILTAIAILPGNETSPVILPLRYGYSIALDTLKNPRTALFGWGPEQFSAAFTHLRPASLNVTDYWNVRFCSSSNYLFEIITTIGLLGLASWVWLAVSAIRQKQTTDTFNQETILKIVLLGTFLMTLLLPGNYLLIATIFFISLIWMVYQKSYHRKTVKDVSDSQLFSSKRILDSSVAEAVHQANIYQVWRYLRVFIVVLLIGLSAGILYFTGTIYAAELAFKRSLDAAQANNGRDTYQQQQAAITRAPAISRYHRAYSATNLALANSIGSSEELTDQQRADITQLIQQSIREGKAAVALNNLNVANWENLASIYRSLINVAQNAPEWTLATLQEAIRHDPTNPQLRLELGGVYYALGGYDQAIRLFQQAAELKPNWANAYYNLAAAHKEKNELARALGYLQQTIQLVDPNSADFAQVRGEIEELQEQVPAQPGQEQPPTPEAQGELSVPAPTTSPNPELDVDLPESAGPDDVTGSEATAQPSPSPQEATGSADQNQ